MAGIPARYQAGLEGGSDHVGWRAELFDAWGNSAPNHWADRAGRHRRVAIGFSALAVPLVSMAGAVVVEGGFLLFSLVHLLTAGCFLWVAWDLIGWASLVGRRRLPHSSVIALVLAVALLGYSCPPELIARFGAMPLLKVGTLMLGAALVILAVDDRNPSPPVALAGRLALISGGAIAGAAELARMVRGLPEYPFYSLGLGCSGLLLAAMALFEGRLLSRGLALAKRGHDRG